MGFVIVQVTNDPKFLICDRLDTTLGAIRTMTPWIKSNLQLKLSIFGGLLLTPGFKPMPAASFGLPNKVKLRDCWSKTKSAFVIKENISEHQKHLLKNIYFCRNCMKENKAKVFFNNSGHIWSFWAGLIKFMGSQSLQNERAHQSKVLHRCLNITW